MQDEFIRTEAELDALVGPIAQASIRKEIAFLHPIYRRWIESSPFAVVATSSPAGLDVSPRGAPAPLVRVLDETTMLLPERRGNNRIDGLRNLIADPRVSVLFFIPGVNETVRVNGTARISANPELLRSFVVNGNAPKCVLQITIDAVYFQCARALLRSHLWTQSSGTTSVPTAGEILAALTEGEVGGPSYDEELPVRQRSTLY